MLRKRCPTILGELALEVLVNLKLLLTTLEVLETIMLQKRCPIILGEQALEDLVNLKLPPITMEALETKGNWQQEVKIFKRGAGVSLKYISV